MSASAITCQKVPGGVFNGMAADTAPAVFGSGSERCADVRLGPAVDFGIPKKAVSGKEGISSSGQT